MRYVAWTVESTVWLQPVERGSTTRECGRDPTPIRARVVDPSSVYGLAYMPAAKQSFPEWVWDQRQEVVAPWKAQDSFLPGSTHFLQLYTPPFPPAITCFYATLCRTHAHPFERGQAAVECVDPACTESHPLGRPVRSTFPPAA